MATQYIIPIASGKGGVGKSTVSANLALALAKTGAAVGLMDADVYGPSIPTMLGITKPPEVDASYRIIDPPPGTGDVTLSLCQSIPLTGVVIVSTPQDIALNVAQRAIAMFKKLNAPILGIIENMSHYVCPRCGQREEIFGVGGARKTAERMAIPVLGEIPLR